MGSDSKDNTSADKYHRQAYIIKYLVSIIVAFVIAVSLIALSYSLEGSVPLPLRIALLSISISVFSSFLMFGFFDVILKEPFYNRLSALVEISFSNTLRAHSNLVESGLLDYSKGLDERRLNNDIDEAEKIFFLQTFMPNVIDLHSSLKAACARNVPITILLLNPTSPIVTIRCKELNYDEEAFRAEIRNNIINLNNIDGKSIKILFYNATPTVSIYGTDKVIHVGYFLQRTYAIKTPHLIIQQNTSYAKFIVDHFEEVCKNATPFEQHEWYSETDNG